MCVYKTSHSGYVIIALYVDYLNIIRTSNELKKAFTYMKNDFEIQDLRETNLCIDLKIDQLSQEVLIHQSAYEKKVLKQFYVDKSFSEAYQCFYIH